jgi:hypothetical protein
MILPHLLGSVKFDAIECFQRIGPFRGREGNNLPTPGSRIDTILSFLKEFVKNCVKCRKIDRLK